MTTERPDVSPAGRYPVLKAAKLLGMSRNTVKAWTRNGNFEADEYNVAKYGHKGLFIYGRAILRVWNAKVIEDKKNG